MSVTFVLGIPHASWRPDRQRSFQRLLGELSTGGDLAPVRGEWRIFSDREPNYAWSAKLWSWALETGATHLLQLQDDALVAPDFWRHLRAMVESVPDAVIGLEAAHPRGAEVGGCWYTTSDMLIGVGYVVPTLLLREFLLWRSRLRKGAIESVNEDTLIGVWCLATGHRIWHPVPTIIDHDVELISTYGNDAHGHRRPTIVWSGNNPRQNRHDRERERPIPEKWPASAPYLGRFYEATPRLARRWVLDATEEDYQRWQAT